MYVDLDAAASTPPLPAVEEAVKAFLADYGSVHRGSGRRSKMSTDAYDRARRVIRRFVGAGEEDYVLFTGNTTGAMNVIAHHLSFLRGGVAVSSLEHSSSLLPFVKAEGERAVQGRQFSLEELDSVAKQIQLAGRENVHKYVIDPFNGIDLESLETLLSSHETKAVVLTASSNLTGYCPPIREVARLAHSHGALMVLDGCQFVQHHALNMRDLGVDFVAASGHKFYAPYGGGFLVGPKRFFDRFLSYQIGGGNLPYITGEGEFLRFETELAHDPGTPNAVGAVAMAAAIEEISKIGLETIFGHEQSLAVRAHEGLSSIPGVELYVKRERLGTVIPFNLKGRNPKEVAEILSAQFDIGVRAGSFCVYEGVRQLLGVTPQEDARIADRVRIGDTGSIPGLIRASVCWHTRIEDVDRLIEAVRVVAGG